MIPRSSFVLLAFAVMAFACSSGDPPSTPHPAPDAGAAEDRRNDGHAWLVDNGGGFCLSWIGVVEAPDGKTWLGAGGGLFPIDASDPERPFAIDLRAIERGPVTALTRIGRDVFAVFGAEEVLQFDASGGRTSLGAASTPIAVSDNGCTALRRDDDLVVRVPGDATFRRVDLPRPKNGFRLGVDAAVGLDDAILVRTYHDGDDLGGLNRVACPGLEVTKVAGGDGIINLGRFVRDDQKRIWAIDRYEGIGTRDYRLMRSDDGGATFAAAAVPDGWQSSVIAVRGDWIVVAPPKLHAVLVSVDRGEHWSVEPIDVYRSVSNFESMSVHISERGVVTVGANCNFLVHRRAPLGT